jgi:NodT family efflux transporter outer membrane factor (OMF) lipoprotein
MFSYGLCYTLLGSVLLLPTGCATVGPDYHPPQTQLSPAWRGSLEGGLTAKADPQRLAAWWTGLNDHELTALIEQAVAGNRDLKKAAARVREARARRGLSQTALYPAVDASGSVARSRGSAETGSASTSDLYSAGLDASWEIDLFGSVRRSIESKDADMAAAGESLRDTLVSLTAEVATNYVDLRSAQGRLDLTEASLKSLEETYNLTLFKWKAGLGDELAVQQARYNLESTRSQLPTLRTSIAGAKNRLSILLGEQPGSLDKRLNAAAPIPVIPASVAVGIPADILRQRPDVRQAERQLASQTAQIGVATAELYPKLKLSGSIGLEALTLGGLFNGSSATSGGLAGISWRVFDAGAIRRNIDIQSALQEQYLIAYEAVVLNALEETENVLVAYAQEQQKRRSLAEAVKAAEKAVELAQIKYRAGLSDFATLLETERSLLNFRDQLMQSDGTVVSNLIKLYKALGGGWQADASQPEKGDIQ